MKMIFAISTVGFSLSFAAIAADANSVAPPGKDGVPKVPRFSIDYMDPSVKPGDDFYHYADGNWIKNNPVPADKSRWASFSELQERNWFLLRQILQDTTKSAVQANSPAQKVRDFFVSAMDTNRLERLGFKPLDPDLKKIARLKSVEEMIRLSADFHNRGIGGLFSDGVSPDAKNSSVYAFSFSQGGLGLPDRDYYLNESFAKQRDAYVEHIARMLTLLGEKSEDATAQAKTILQLETAIAKASRTRVELRDPIANYHKFTVGQVVSNYPGFPLKVFLVSSGLEKMPDLIVHQPEFFTAMEKLSHEHPLADWQAYLRWHLVNSSARYLHAAAENEHFAFYGKILSGQQEQEPRWQRSARIIDSEIGEALGQLFVEKHFPPSARARMAELVENLKVVFRDRLTKLDWMTDATRAKAMAKFERFTQKIGHPDKFRDYSSVKIDPDDLLGNVRRADAFESHRQLVRVGKQVDRTEWHMTPETVNAYFNPSQNEIVFPAGILQPPFFDPEMDDAVNYGAIGVVIGHEMTHGYDDQGRKYDADGNLNDWWTADDAKAFEGRAQKVVEQYNAYEPLPGLHVNGKLTLGENIADLGGTSIAYEALQRVLAKNPSRRKNIDGFTPEQRFYISLSQIWRTNCREEEMRRLITVDPHSPGQFRAIGPHVNMQEFFDAFKIGADDKMWRAPELRAKIW
ncbi:MAG TPA: M13 family metallopeptidase [Candidatus Dormibacteraeota bacterium]|nr:M13 family metallopeptidase [Candidatus Dormibacteraeota bacterium]